MILLPRNIFDPDRLANWLTAAKAAIMAWLKELK